MHVVWIYRNNSYLKVGVVIIDLIYIYCSTSEQFL